MKISENFDVREFVPASIFNKWGTKSIYFVNKRVVNLAEFYKKFFGKYYQDKFNDPTIIVLVVVNDWHYSKNAVKQSFRGFRPPDCETGGELSQHKFKDAFDCDIIIVFGSGKRIEADYKEVQKVIIDNEKAFMDAGLTTIEAIEFAPTWLHSDCRWTGLDKILIVKPST